jgi:menaquinone-9 beta-reductase
VPHHTTDLFIVGGGPAGLATAIAARLKGFSVTVADADRPPVNKACGEGLMPDSLAALRCLGVRIAESKGFAFDGIRFRGDQYSVDASFPEGHGIGIRRTLLHQCLIDRAMELGVSMLWGTRVTGISEGRVLLDGLEVESRWVVGADGENSRVRRWTGLDRARHESLRYGFRRHYCIAPWTTRMEIWWGLDCQIYITPVSGEEVCVVVLGRDPHLRFEQALPRFPELQARLAGASIASPERGAVTASRRLERVFRGNTALIGDASGSVDAITGEGLCLSFRQATALADALVSGDLSSYQLEHRRLARPPALMAALMLSLEQFEWLRPCVLRGLASRPAIFQNLLGMHVGELSKTDFLLHGMLPLAWQMLIAS